MRRLLVCLTALACLLLSLAPAGPEQELGLSGEILNVLRADRREAAVLLKCAADIAEDCIGVSQKCFGGRRLCQRAPHLSTEATPQRRLAGGAARR